MKANVDNTPNRAVVHPLESAAFSHRTTDEVSAEKEFYLSEGPVEVVKDCINTEKVRDPAPITVCVNQLVSH